MIAIPKLVSLGFLSIGIFVLMQVILPIISFQVWEVGQQYSSKKLISPKQDIGGQVLGVSVKNKDNFPSFFSNLTREIKPSYEDFKLSIPKLKIEEAKVFVDSNDLSTGLAQLPGSALPGEKGNLFISGHSALSPLFSFKTAIFARLTDLKKGDEIVIEAGGAKFRYEVADLRVVDPKDLSVVNAPDSQGRYVSLMTCVPPGLNFKRLVVLGKML